MNIPRNRITSMTLDEISLVRSGDDPGANVVIAKSDPEESSPQQNNDLLKALRNVLLEKQSSNEEEVTLAATPAGDKGTGKDAESMAEFDFDVLPEDVQSYIAELEDFVADAAEELEVNDEAVLDEKELVVAKSDEDLALISKVDDLEARLAEQTEIAKNERDIRLEQEAIAKANELSTIGKSEDLAPLLQRLDELDPEASEQVQQILKAAHGKISAGDVFKTVGSDYAGEASGEIDSLVSDITKADSSISDEEAMVMAFERNPELYDPSATYNERR